LNFEPVMPILTTYYYVSLQKKNHQLINNQEPRVNYTSS